MKYQIQNTYFNFFSIVSVIDVEIAMTTFSFLVFKAFVSIVIFLLINIVLDIA